ncbi:MAG: hypothetical protein RL355_294 [Actinomycetota bacterium]|jgi:hypothetical protein
MRNSRYRYTRLVMALDAVGIFIAGALLLAIPDTGLDFHGLGSSLSDVWFARFIGLLLITLSILLSTTSRHVEDKAFQRAALALIGINAIAAMSLYGAPGQITTGREVSTVIFGFVAFLFLITLPIKPIGYKETEK